MVVPQTGGGVTSGGIGLKEKVGGISALDSPRLIIAALGFRLVGFLSGLSLPVDVLVFGLVALISHRLVRVDTSFRPLSLIAGGSLLAKIVWQFAAPQTEWDEFYPAAGGEIAALAVAAVLSFALMWLLFTSFIRLASVIKHPASVTRLKSSRLYVAVLGATSDAAVIGTALAARPGSPLRDWVTTTENTLFLRLATQGLAAVAGIALLVGFVRLWRVATAYDRDRSNS